MYDFENQPQPIERPQIGPILAMLVLIVLLFWALDAFADNIGVTQGSGKTVSTDTIGGIEFPRHKIIVGPDNTNDGDVEDDRPMPTWERKSSAVSGYTSSDITTTTASELIAAGSGGTRHYIESFAVSNSHASQGTIVELLNGSTVVAHCPAGPNYGGCTRTFKTPIRGSSNTAINCRAVTSGAAVRCSVTGFDSTK